MERVKFLLLLMFALSFYYLRVLGSEGSLFVSKLHERCKVEEREALLNFKQSLHDPQRLLTNWKSSEDCCTWKGVGCSNTMDHVIKLDFKWTYINDEGWLLSAASLVPSLFRLQHLQYLCLSGIYFNFTSIPQSINSLISLDYLDLSFSGFAGVIPLHLGNLTNLRHLDLSWNDVEIDMAVDSWLFRLKQLQYLSLSGVSLNESNILQKIDSLAGLTYLDLRDSSLEGLIPQSLGQLMNLVHLDLRTNQLQGSLSDVNFANLSQLNYLGLSNNHLNFNMVSLNWVPPFQVSYLYLSSCFIGPHFPLWLQTQKFLLSLDLSNSGISDIIPSWFWTISSQISYLKMSHNAIRGELPMSLNTSSEEVMIDLGSNLLEGRLPQLMNCTISAIFSNNKFSKGIEWYLNANMSRLQKLDLSQNHLSGEIPDSICQMNSLVHLDLSHNNLSGKISECPRSILRSTWLTIISLTNNNLTGSIPQWIGNLQWLVSLHLSNNNFQGDISFLRNNSKLITLDLGENKFTGNIPLWIGDRLSSLKILRLRSNKFYGPIPSELSKLKGLQILDLANNFLSGPLPKSFKFLKSMTMLESNFLPYFLVQNKKRSFSDSLMITIKGIELEYTSTLPIVMIMDLSCNNLIGEVPTELMSLVGLISLNLSSNQFIGQIPINIGVMQSLQSLDLSRNHFFGKIPESIVNLSGLEHLDLSYNQLSGRIPEGGQLNTFDELSYYENPELCGKPLLKTCEGDKYNIHNGGSNSDDDDNFGLFLGMGLGFVVGLWSVLGTLLLKRSWAIAYFQFCDNMTNNIYVFIIVKVNRWFNQ